MYRFSTILDRTEGYAHQNFPPFPTATFPSLSLSLPHPPSFNLFSALSHFSHFSSGAPSFVTSVDQWNMSRTIQLVLGDPPPTAQEEEFLHFESEENFIAHSISISNKGFGDQPMETSSTKSSIQSEGSLESERASSKASSSSDFEASPPSRVHTHWLGFISALKKGPVSRLQTFQPTLSIPRFPRRKSKSVGDNVISPIDPVLDSDFYCIRSSWWNFSLAQIMDATDNFNHCNLIGQGGYSEVYKGLLPDGRIVAIKRLTRGSPEEMTADFLSELGIIAHVNHPNVSKIIGYGVDGGMHLVLPLSPNGSLASVLSGSKEKLSWDIRYRIALGTAKGLTYLHEGCQRRIIHKDIKAANILLSEDFEPQISDFGLAKWLPENCTHHTVTKFEGTFGYLPPEFFLHGMVDEKTDVYAYGVLLLELITGRLALDSSKQSLVIWAKPLLTKENIGQLVDPSLGDAYDSEEMDRMVLTASWCIHHSSAQRPQMSQVVKLLCGDQECIELANQCQSQRPTLQRVYSEEISDEKDYNSTKCFKDHNQRLQIA